MPKIDIPLRYDIAKNKKRYDRIKILLESDEDKYLTDEFCLRFPNEAGNARQIRKELFRKSFKNISGDLIGATKDAIFHEGVRLEFTGEESNPLSTWAEDVTMGLDRTSLLDFAADYTIYDLRAYGHVWTVLDKPDYLAANFQDELKNGAPYITNIFPGDVQYYELENGELSWFAYNYTYCPLWSDPTLPPPVARPQLRVWTKDKFIIIDRNYKTPPKIIQHDFGFVPVIWQSFIAPSDPNSILGITPFFTTSNMIIFANNMQSIADLELIKHGNSVLLVNEETISGMNTEVDGQGVEKTKLHDTGGFNKFVYSGETKPEYLTKDLGAVPMANDQAMYYFSMAIQNERSLQSIGTKRDTVRESGVTKSYDAEPARVALRATAQDLETWCKKVLNMVALLFGRENLADSYVCEFPENFILTKSIDEKFEAIKKSIESQYPSETGRKEMYKSLTPDIAHNAEIRKVINKEIDDAEIELRSPDQIMKEVNDKILAEGNVVSNSPGEEAGTPPNIKGKGAPIVEKPVVEKE